MMEIHKNIDTLKACRFCPMCRHVCTSGNISFHESDYPRGRGLILDNILEQRMEYNPDLVQSIYNCCLCGLCWSNCEGGYMPHKLILSARRDIVEKGAVPEAASNIIKRIESGKNPYGLKSKAYRGNGRKADVLYFMGDFTKFSGHPIAISVENIMQKAGEKYAILDEEPTDGKIMAIMGFREKAIKTAESLSNRFKDIGAKKIVVSDPLSYDCLKNDFPAYGIELDARIMHISEYLEECINKARIKVGKVKDHVTLLDSEFLGRFNGIYDAPRKVIKAVAGGEFKEMVKNKEYALATGEASFLFNGKTSLMGKMIGSRICEAVSSIDAGISVTLSGIAKENLGKCKNIKIFEISEFIWQNIE
jgi:Fe-S oxidoreductase